MNKEMKERDHHDDQDILYDTVSKKDMLPRKPFGDILHVGGPHPRRSFVCGIALSGDELAAACGE